MALNPYAEIAKAAELFGPSDAVQIARAAARGYAAAHRVTPKIRAEGFAGIPGLKSNRPVNDLASRSGAVSKGVAGIGQTITRLTQTGTLAGGAAVQQLTGGVIGAPSLTLRELANGGVESNLRRYSPWVRYFTSADMSEFQRIMRRIVLEARRLSRGRLSYRRLAEMHHPYGRGERAPAVRIRDSRGRWRTVRYKRRKLPKSLASKRHRQMGAESIHVVNRHTGIFERGWTGQVVRQNLYLDFQLINPTYYAKYLAFGTPLMRAHGPFAVAILMYRNQIDIAFRRAARNGYMEARAAGVTY